MESPEQSDVGYPEEQPAEVTPDESGGPQEGVPDEDAERAPDNDDGTATGNP